MAEFSEETKQHQKQASFSDRCFAYLPLNERPQKPRDRLGLTEIRGPYYSAYGKRHVEDLFETMGMYIDVFKFAGGSFALMPKSAVVEMIEICHKNKCLVSTGGFIERVLSYGNSQVTQFVDKYLHDCTDLGMDIVEISAGFIQLPTHDLARLVAHAAAIVPKVKAEVGIQFGAGGGSTTIAEHEAEGTRDVATLLEQGRKCLEAGAWMLMIESEGITEQVSHWRTDVVSRIVDEFGLEKIMFEAAEPAVFEWYIKTLGIDVNLFVDHEQIVQLESLRSGTWGSKSTWGRMLSFKAPAAEPKGDSASKG